MKKPLLAVLILCAVANSAIAEPASKEKVLEYFGAIKIKEKYETSMLAGFDMGFDMADNPSYTAEQREQMQSLQKKMKDLLLSEMGWEKMEAEFTALYQEAYTDQDLAEIIPFMKSPAGKKMAETEINLIGPATKLGQKKMQELMPKIMALATQQ